MCAQRRAYSFSLSNGGCPAEALEQDAAEGVYVSSGIEVLPLDLLGSRIERSPGKLPRRSEDGLGCRVPAHPEVGEVRALAEVGRPPACDENVAGLHVQVDEADRVRLVECARNLGQQ